MTFSEVRAYQYGDDIRSIDWNVTARYNHPYVKIFEEERELTVMLLIDVSASRNFGTVSKLKRIRSLKLRPCWLSLRFKTMIRLVLFSFSDRIEKFIPPKKDGRIFCISSGNWWIFIRNTRKRISLWRCNI